MTTEPKNEARICDEVMHVIEKRDGGPLKVSDQPDKNKKKIAKTPPAVELLFESPTKRYAIEHTRIESFPGQIADSKPFSSLLDPLETELLGKLPGCFYLAVDVGATDSIEASKHQRIRDLIKQWILSKASVLSDKGPRNSVTEQPPGVPFALTLHRAQKSGSRLLIRRFAPEELETLRGERVLVALSKKCPKLAAHKAEGRETVLALESNDNALGNYAVIGVAVSQALAGRDDVPDTIFLVETELQQTWYIWTLKEGADVYPCERLDWQDPVEVQCG